ncbi:MAG: hypothetical protein A2381_16680 [Bdellovibrionales bacterium RIFOXYB1_FULL_37_110]|nr:MAG: hypothetical protein A2181_07685 [Bdellovibrionales bacterium RIFOXYA1_FULL_38_20]OFZ50034.1 MAG: hypothetical protein A2417_18515 [Bdellovibrionales bacterium RIFOXYC1_FULL_37_79]OFZ59940.1 MAG: hypothetical protein A2381_16680 [Bdellovibrionales bacterium RIFOXYB1_FULL_37_110]OFZ63911.1 MAG: hypothetical protein A2577_05870 [Bdellovibrionales bacterium RIFOXYD1_FULL_36_51]
MNFNRFQRVSQQRPRWEGIIFPGIDSSNRQISIAYATPNKELSNYIESMWFMSWNIENPNGLPCIIIPNPCCKFVCLQTGNVTNRPLFIGTREKADIFSLTGSGSTIGLDFQPGAFYPILKKAINKDWPESGLYADEFLEHLPLPPNEKWKEENLSKWLNSFEDYLLKLLLNSKEQNYKKIKFATEGILEGCFQVPEELAHQCDMSTRTLQRIFKKEVGLSPKNVLRIARFNDAIRKIGQDNFTEFVEVALASGFFDQAHMVNEFQKLVATSPSKFRRYL